jgi:two-component system chemotaxis response regulator CheB
MTIRVLIVDDSSFIRKRIQQLLLEQPGFEVVGMASNGQEAIFQTLKLKPDVITMDIEMPVMDGITAVRQIMAQCPTPILMFSVATQIGASSTFEALNAGAVDFLPKQLDDIDNNREAAKNLIRHRIRTVAMQAGKLASKAKSPSKPASESAHAVSFYSSNASTRPATRRLDLLVIVASTGGPVAIQRILAEVKKNCHFPILLVQHMPHNFTKSFADRLNQVCQVAVREAVQGDLLIPGQALLCPGGMQIEIKPAGGKKTVVLREKAFGEIYSPCADITLSSIADCYNANVLTVVLTGMGSDGKEGAKKLKTKGLSIWAQDEASCTIYGMPRAVIEAKLADKVYSLDEIAHELSKLG